MWVNALHGKPRRYKDHDYEMVYNWFFSRGIAPPSRLFLPEIGYLVEGVAAGFLVQTDTSVAVLDYMVSGLGVDPSLKARSIVAIADSLIREAEYLGYEAVKCDTLIDSIANKAIDLGFKEQGSFRTFIKRI